MVMLDLATAPRMAARQGTWQQSQVEWDTFCGWLATPGTVKDCGSYVFGRLRDGVRANTHLVDRCALTLDADTATPALPDMVEMVLGCAAAVYTTFNSTPDAPRFRVVLPLDRRVTAEEYAAAADRVMDLLGADNFDRSSNEPTRLMLMPSAADPAHYSLTVHSGEPLAVDELLAGWAPDLSTARVPNTAKRDPFEIEGAVGAFNRAYSIGDAIHHFKLPYVAAGDEHWQLMGTRSKAGVNPIGPGLVYSHHVTDPAYGRACSAFDLVRLHRFSDLDLDAPADTPIHQLPSHEAMLRMAGDDPAVQREMAAAVAFDELPPTPADITWNLSLRFNNRTGKFVDEISNWDLVTANDSAFKALAFNDLTMAIEITGPLPWRERGTSDIFGAADWANMALYLEREYRAKPTSQRIEHLVLSTAHKRRINPVRDYQLALERDGVPRVETCLPGVVPNPYTRMVARKAMAAAAARMLTPGVKWDHTVVLFGKEGLGKSWWVEKMAKGHSASLGPIQSKDTLLTMQRSWLMLSDEGHSLRRDQANELKEFLTRTTDVFRIPYEREATAHPRHCVIWSSTNDQVFLRRQEGNRRFLIVHCTERVDFTALTDHYIDQVWAEAVHLWRAGEPLFLDEAQAALAATNRADFTEEDALEGVIWAYVNRLYPEDWSQMDTAARQLWGTMGSDGVKPLDELCTAQVWVEVLGKQLGDHRRVDLLEIGETLRRMGWVPGATAEVVPNYGPQIVYRRP